jgi:hypothetical protein
VAALVSRRFQFRASVAASRRGLVGRQVGVGKNRTRSSLPQRPHLAFVLPHDAYPAASPARPCCHTFPQTTLPAPLLYVSSPASSPSPRPPKSSLRRPSSPPGCTPLQVTAFTPLRQHPVNPLPVSANAFSASPDAPPPPPAPPLCPPHSPAQNIPATTFPHPQPVRARCTPPSSQQVVPQPRADMHANTGGHSKSPLQYPSPPRPTAAPPLYSTTGSTGGSRRGVNPAFSLMSESYSAATYCTIRTGIAASGVGLKTPAADTGTASCRPSSPRQTTSSSRDCIAGVTKNCPPPVSSVEKSRELGRCPGGDKAPSISLLDKLRQAETAPLYPVS